MNAARLHRPLLLGGIIALALAPFVGCDSKSEVTTDGARQPAACLTVGTYGNASLCEDSTAGREKCGSSVTRICAGGWLCFDDARTAFCTCSRDSDCTRRAAYINQGRALRKMAPIGSTCVEGRCVGLP